MNIFVSLLWIISSLIQRALINQSIIDYHLIGGLTSSQCQVNVIVQQKYLLSAIGLKFYLFEETGNQVTEINLVKAFNQTSFKVKLQNLKESQNYLFKYELILASSDEELTKALELKQRDTSQYYYSNIQEGRFKTFENLQKNFTFVASSCAQTMSNSYAFEAIKSLKPDFFINVGDFHYTSSKKIEPNLIRSAYHEQLKAYRQRELYTETPLVYIFDDHDAGPNNVDAHSISLDPTNQIYQELIPHYELASSNKSRGAQQVFQIGKIIFLMNDLRSFKNLINEDDGKLTNFGKEQYQWTKQQIIKAAQNEEIEGLVWIMPFPWYSQREWNTTTTFHEKEELGNLIMELGYNTEKLGKFLMLISGDTHLLSFDTGFMNKYGRFPIFQCSPIDSKPSCKQGGYTGEIYINRGQFCHFQVYQSPVTKKECVKFRGFVQSKQVMHYDLCDMGILQYQEESSQFFDQLLKNESLSEEERSILNLEKDFLYMGSFCPPTIEVKIDAAKILLGSLYLVLILYNVLRNVFNRKIE